MDKRAVEKAKVRLEKAESNLKQAKVSSSFKEFSSAWTDFLLAGNSVHTILEQGAKQNPKSRQWFGGKNKLRTKDPLLKYMHQARNSDEHGIAPILAHKGDSILLGTTTQGSSGRSGIYFNNVTITNSGLKGEYVVDGGGELTITQAPHVQLIAVTNERYKNTFDPPAEHLGKMLSDRSPIGIGALWLSYLGDLVMEASSSFT